MRGATIVLMKGYNGKSRLCLNQRFRMMLINALINDIIETISETKNKLWDCFIASPDKLFSRRCEDKKVSVINLEPGNLNFIFKQIQNWAVENGYDAIILCAGDLPLLHSTVIGLIKKRLEIGVKTKGKSMIVCPSKGDGVSIIAMSPPNLWGITEYEGVRNLDVIKNLNLDIYPYQILEDIRVYIDLDEPEDIASVFMLMEENPVYWSRHVKRVLDELLTAGVIKIENVY